MPCAQVRCPVGIWNCATWSETERWLLSWSTAEGEAVAMHQWNIGWQFHIPTGQRTCAQGAIDQWTRNSPPTFQVSQGSAATDLRWGENFNKILFQSTFLNIVVKRLWKSVNIWQSYQKNKSGTFFYGPRCIWVPWMFLNVQKVTCIWHIVVPQFMWR